MTCGVIYNVVEDNGDVAVDPLQDLSDSTLELEAFQCSIDGRDSGGK